MREFNIKIVKTNPVEHFEYRLDNYKMDRAGYSDTSTGWYVKPRNAVNSTAWHCYIKSVRP